MYQNSHITNLMDLIIKIVKLIANALNNKLDIQTLKKCYQWSIKLDFFVQTTNWKTWSID